MVQVLSLFFFQVFHLALNESKLMCIGKVVISLTTFTKTIGDLYINHIKLIYLGILNIFTLYMLSFMNIAASS